VVPSNCILPSFILQSVARRHAFQARMRIEHDDLF